MKHSMKRKVGFLGRVALARCALGGIAVVHTAHAALPPVPVSPTPVIKYEYDADGNPTKTVVAPAALSLATKQGYDNLGRKKTITDAKQGVVSFDYDLLDQIKSIGDPRQVVTRYSPTGLGDVLQLASPDTGTANSLYDPAGNLKTRTDARGVVASFTYDELGRPKQVVYTGTSASSRTISWTYDQTGPSFGYGVGRLTTVATPEVTTTMRYDALGRVTMAVQTGQGVPLVVSTDYDDVGHVTGLVYPSGRSVAFTWASGQPTKVAVNVGNGPTTLLDQVTTNAFGGVKGWVWQLGGVARSHDRVFDTNGRLVRHPLGNLVRDVTYDAADRIATYTHYLASTGQSAPAYDQTFGYDELDRLVTVTGSTSWSYAYDASGNRTSVTSGAGSVRSFTVAPDSNRLAAISNPVRSLSYDAAGNTSTDVQSGASSNYSAVYSLEGRLAEMSQGTSVVKLEYDAFGRRVARLPSTKRCSERPPYLCTVNPSTDYLIYAYDGGGHLIGEYRGNGTPVTEYVWLGDTPVAVITGAGAATAVFAVHTDHLDTPRMLVDGQGQVRWRWMGEPFGANVAEEQPTAGLAAVRQNLRFPGQQFEAFGGRHYNYFRDYDPSTGRYVQSDPIGLNGGINTYAYVGGNPVNYIDEDGLAACKVLYPDYPIEVADGVRFDFLGGHGGVVSYDSKGLTQYYEYGRYKPSDPAVVGARLPEDDGNVRRLKVPDLKMDKNGQPTAASFEALRKALSERAGHFTKVEMTCDSNADEKKVVAYAMSIANDAKRAKYSWKPWSKNQCRTFAERSFEAGRQP